jgi:glycosyltransferase involved in cell wall biosynthesis
MRLLHVHSGNLFGGVETMLLTVARFQHTTPLEHSFALFYDGRVARELRAIDVPVYLLGPARLRNLPSIWRARRRLRDLLVTGSFDAAVCHLAWSQALFGKTIVSTGCDQLFWMHDAGGGSHWLDRLARRVRPALAICNSRYTASTLPRLYSNVKYEVIHYPVLPSLAGSGGERRFEVRQELNTPPDAIVIVQVSRMQHYKGHRVLIDALAQLRDSSLSPAWTCWIVGGAQRPEELRLLAGLNKQVIAAKLADRVRFCGERSDIARILGAADIFCHPHTSPEPFGIALVEALGAGLPVVTSDLGGACEIVDPSCGIRGKANDPAELATALEALLDDPAMRRRLGEAAPARARALCDPAERMGELTDLIARRSAERMKKDARSEIASKRTLGAAAIQRKDAGS